MLFFRYFFSSKPFESLETLDRHNQIHNDIKPQNFLVKLKNGPTDLNQIEIVLTDFGMADPKDGKMTSKGGTPIFASPECFERKEKKSDIFSCGRVILFLLLTKNQFVKWLFVPVKDQIRFSSIQVLKSNDSGQYLNLISKMTSLTDRITLQAARIWFDDLRIQSNICLKPALENTIDTVINAEISPENEVYVSELCDFRYEILQKYGTVQFYRYDTF